MNASEGQAPQLTIPPKCVVLGTLWQSLMQLGEVVAVVPVVAVDLDSASVPRPVLLQTLSLGLALVMSRLTLVLV